MARSKGSPPSTKKTSGKGKGKKTARAEKDDDEEVEIEEEEEGSEEPALDTRRRKKGKTNTPTKTKAVTPGDTLEAFLTGKFSKIRNICTQSSHYCNINNNGKKMLCVYNKNPRKDNEMYVKYCIGATLGWTDNFGDINSWLLTTGNVSGMGPDCPMWKVITKSLTDAQRSKYLVIKMAFDQQAQIQINSDHDPSLSKGNPTGSVLKKILTHIANPNVPDLRQLFFNQAGALRSEVASIHFFVTCIILFLPNPYFVSLRASNLC
jgi:hypothetical protein